MIVEPHWKMKEKPQRHKEPSAAYGRNPKELATEVTEDTESDVTLLSVLGDLGG